MIAATVDFTNQVVKPSNVKLTWAQIPITIPTKTKPISMENFPLDTQVNSPSQLYKAKRHRSLNRSPYN